MDPPQEPLDDASTGAVPAAEPAAPDDAMTAERAVPPAPAEESAAALRDRWLRAEADLQNYRRRAQRDLEEARRAAEESVLLEVVAAIDDLERALEAIPGEGAAVAWAEGVRLVAQHLRETLARRGVTVVDPLGEPFDPSFHEALLELPAPPETAPGTVVQVALKGYRRGARALRAARVVVARAADGGE